MTNLSNSGLSAADHGGDIEAAKKCYRKAHFLDLSININPWGPPIKLWLAIIRNLFKLREYPQPYACEGRKLLADFLEIKAEQLVLGNGAAELIRYLPYALPVQRAVVIEPTFSEYGQAFLAAGKPVVKVELEDHFQIPWARLTATLQAGDLLFICQPNNPTGALLTQKDLSQIVELVNLKGCWLAIDESFLWFVGDIRALSFYRCINQFTKLIIINSLTKIGSIPGLRLGFVIANPETASLIAQSLDQWNVNWLAQKAIVTILDLKYLSRAQRRIKAENDWLKVKLATIKGIKVFAWDANFYLLKVEAQSLQSGILRCRLGDEGILVRDCSNFNGLGPDYLRVAVGNRYQNRLFINILRRILNS
jgi:threonine-phosphate decarboxylase